MKAKTVFEFINDRIKTGKITVTESSSFFGPKSWFDNETGFTYETETIQNFGAVNWSIITVKSASSEEAFTDDVKAIYHFYSLYHKEYQK